MSARLKNFLAVFFTILMLFSALIGYGNADQGRENVDSSAEVTEQQTGRVSDLYGEL